MDGELCGDDRYIPHGLFPKNENIISKLTKSKLEKMDSIFRVIQVPGKQSWKFYFLVQLLLPGSCPEFYLYGLDESPCMNCYHCLSVRVHSGLGLLGTVNHHVCCHKPRFSLTSMYARVLICAGASYGLMV